MNGLKVITQNNNQSMSNIGSFTSVGQVSVNAGTKVFTVAAPAEIIPLVVGAPITTHDAKVYLRQSKKDYYIHNNAEPCYIKVTRFRVRKNISVSDFASYTALLNRDAAIQTTTYAQPLTTSNAAQRYLKFGKTRLIKLNQGALHHLKMNAKFGCKLVDENVEANTLYIGTKITRGMIV